jgi:hypothetical protein
MSDEIHLPPVEPPDPIKAAKQESAPLPPRPPQQQRSVMDGCLLAIGIIIIGVFVLAGLVFATCFLGSR